MLSKVRKLVPCIAVMQLLGCNGAYSKDHPGNTLHITNTTSGRIDFEVKADGPSWDASSGYVVQSNFPMGNGVSAFFPLKAEQTVGTTQYWVRTKKPGESWSAPKKMKEVDGSLDLK